MAAVGERMANREMAVWLAAALALMAAIFYVLMGQHVLGTGLNVDAEGGAIVYVAAGGYLLGGLLILARRRSLWIAGLMINTLVMFAFFSMHGGNPAVLLSPGGLASKAAQALMAVSLLYLIAADWLRARTA
jgi:hypothetical protein